jgi:pyruvate dehydrogenase complex dehydrogenase (E1) component
LLELVSDMTDDQLWKLSRGGYDPEKVYNAYAAAMRHKGGLTVILAKTVNGFGMGEAGEGQNINHQLKKLGANAVRAFRDRFSLDISDDQLEELPYLKSTEGRTEALYLKARRAQLGGYVPARFSYVEQCLDGKEGPVVVATDYMKNLRRPDSPNCIYASFRRFVVLGTDGFGQSDDRESLRRFFEVGRYFIAVAALKVLADDGQIPRNLVSQAIAAYKINPQKQNPATV